MHPSGDSEAADVFDFVDEFLGDKEKGEVRPLAHYLARYPRSQPAVAREYLALSGEEARTNGAIPSGAPDGAADERRIGPYRILSEIGRGGQGAVFLAEDSRIARRVALKVLASRLDFVSEERRRRFRREAEVIARLEHPGICGIYDADIDGETPYIAMRLVAGRTLAEILTEARTAAPKAAAEESKDSDLSTTWPPGNALDVRRVLLLFERIARALHAAHEAGVVHRDVKPGNVIVAAGGQPVLLDFGLARDEQGDMDPLTQSGDLFGTPAYMSPEQLSGSEGALDRRTDVYSLAVSLYEALTLARPFEGASRVQLLVRIRSESVPDARGKNPQLSEEVQVVLETALERERARRYATALEFAEDLRRIREYEPIRARPAGILLRFSRWVQRHPALAVSIIGTIMALAGGLGLTLHLLGKADSALQVALGHHLAQRCLDLIPEDPMAALALGIEAADREIRELGSEQGADYLTRSALFEALDACWLEQVVSSEARFATDMDSSPDGRILVIATDEGFTRGFDLETRAQLFHVTGPPGRIVRVFLTPDGSRIATASANGKVLVFDRATSSTLREMESESPLIGADLAASGTRLLTVSRTGKVEVLDLEKGARDLEIDPSVGAVDWACFHPRGAGSILVRTAAGAARIVDARTGGTLAELETGKSPVVACAFDPVRDRVAAATADGGVHICELPSGASARAHAHVGEKPGFLGFSPDGRRLFLATDRGEEGSAFLIDTDSGACRTIAGHQGRRVVHGAFSPDGTRLATASHDTTVRIWDAAAGTELRVMRSVRDRPIASAWTADGKRLITLNLGRIVNVWFARNRPDLYRLPGHTGPVVRARFSRDNCTALTASSDGTARLWSVDAASPLEPGAELHVLRHEGPVTDACFGAGDEEVLTASADGMARRWSRRTGSLLSAPFAHPSAVLSVEPDPEGDRFLTVCADGRARVFDFASGAAPIVLSSHGGSMLKAAFSPDGALVAGGGEGDTIGIWKTADGSLVRSISYERYKDAIEGGVVALAFHPRSPELAAACGDARIRFRNPETGEPSRSDAIVFPSRSLAYSADGGGLLVTGKYGGGAAKVIFAGQKPSPASMTHVGSVTGGALSADGSVVLTFARDGTAHVWRSKTGEPVTHRKIAAGPILDGAFDGSGSSPRVITACEDGSVSIWPVDPLPAARARKPRQLYDAEYDREVQLALPLVYD